ncbi:hypothetical protein [Chamaesiphon sp. OTE_75_metabat_556]|jgi:hypothetical protein|uniref:ParE family toxin-like protein n=1 Tax=Chamaesiphon sp. OTE_75_metabat_556 TaxID=2964692 RepID=UPI00286B5D06|nr:hypothetical protein [Chamaesiphon sp. OTE_75_metabat_556]
MKSSTTSDFWQAYKELSPAMKRRAKKAYKLWQENSLHPSLHFKKVGKKLWSVRISGGCRALALKEGDDYYWIWIGEHNEYEQFLN